MSFCLVPPLSVPTGERRYCGISQRLDERVGAAKITQPIGGAEVVEVLIDSQRLVEHHGLRTVAQVPGNLDISSVGTQLAREDTQQRGLARAVLADDTDERAGPQLETDTAQHVMPTE